MSDKPAGIYVHIPFCRQKCPYCDFYSLPPAEEVKQQYVDTLCRSFRRFPSVQADSLYFGGGTPTLLSAAQITQIVQAAKTQFAVSGEITIEANPGSVTAAQLKELHASGINRISFGVQSGVEKELTALGRTHTVKQAEQALLWASQAGFTQISVDLMLGIPHQTMESLQTSLSLFAKPPVTHLSCYMLKIEPRTPFGKTKDSLVLPDEDAVCDLYLWLCDHLAKHGYLQYEISNFAIPGMESKHNLKYWTGLPYLGFGPAAHSFFEGKRFFYPPDLQSYLASDGKNIITDPAPIDSLEEYCMLRLRLRQGISLIHLKNVFGIAPNQLLPWAKPYLSAGLCIQPDAEHLALSPKGMLLSNPLIVDLLQHLTS